ncbi:hypothetical protein, partial [Peribacillus simplex]|uniref:hypothetical protein n=1 Tax=Peribacillus simplex TaxID=1478 RepID=UPI000AD7B711
ERKDLEKQLHTLGKMEARVPEFKGQIQAQEKGLGLLEGIMNGIEQAGRDMQREHKQEQKRLTKTKSKGKSRPSGWEMEK